MRIERLAIYCGSSFGADEIFRDAAARMAEAMAARGIELVYGGGHAGLMGVVADAILAKGGQATGVITRYLKDKELAHQSLTRLHLTESMHDRKSLMGHLSDGFIALPGGLGTLEEIMEVISWAQLELHDKPCGFLNTSGFYSHLASQLDQMVEQGFVSRAHRDMLHFDEDPDALLDAFEAYEPSQAPKLFPIKD